MANNIRTRSDPREAQKIFIEQLPVERTVALRIFRQIQALYSAQIAEATQDDLLNAARWAAGQLRSRFDAETLSTIDLPRLRAALADDDCPWCFKLK